MAEWRGGASSSLRGCLEAEPVGRGPARAMPSQTGAGTHLHTTPSSMSVSGRIH